MYCDALGWELPAARRQRYGNAKWVYLTRDARSAYYFWRRGDLTIGDWIRSWHGIKVDAMFSWRDQAPFWHELTGPGRRRLTRQGVQLWRTAIGRAGHSDS
jgi:predicted ATP-grasp superfamily ATP-dependent carboligase